MSRGNQRDTDRARAAARAAQKGVTSKEKDGLTTLQRKERDAKALQEKQAKKAAEQGALLLDRCCQVACQNVSGLNMDAEHSPLCAGGK